MNSGEILNTLQSQRAAAAGAGGDNYLLQDQDNDNTIIVNNMDEDHGEDLNKIDFLNMIGFGDLDNIRKFECLEVQTG